jgi:hypothetical protein
MPRSPAMFAVLTSKLCRTFQQRLPYTAPAKFATRAAEIAGPATPILDSHFDPF